MPLFKLRLLTCILLFAAGLTGGAYVDGFKLTDAGFPNYTDLERPG